MCSIAARAQEAFLAVRPPESACWSAVRKAFFAIAQLIKISVADSNKKNPRIEKINPGMSLFYPPILMDIASLHEAPFQHSGRSSDFSALSAAFPFPVWNSGTQGWKGSLIYLERAGLQRRAHPRLSRGSLLSSMQAPERTPYLLIRPATEVKFFCPIRRLKKSTLDDVH